MFTFTIRNISTAVQLPSLSAAQSRLKLSSASLPPNCFPPPSAKHLNLKHFLWLRSWGGYQNVFFYLNNLLSHLHTPFLVNFHANLSFLQVLTVEFICWIESVPVHPQYITLLTLFKFRFRVSGAWNTLGKTGWRNWVYLLLFVKNKSCLNMLQYHLWYFTLVFYTWSLKIKISDKLNCCHKKS